MLNEKLHEALNGQCKAKLYSAYLYILDRELAKRGSPT